VLLAPGLRGQSRSRRRYALRACPASTQPLHDHYATTPTLAQARDINLDIKRVVAYRHWCNKLWNAIKFAMMNLPPGFAPPAEPLDAQTCPPACRWVLSRLNNATTVIIQVSSTAVLSVA
jgi:valyl-tRNA synthetase